MQFGFIRQTLIENEKDYMTPNLRPMNLGEILDRTFQIYRSRFLVFIAIAALPALVMMGLNLADVFWLHLHSIIHPPTEIARVWNAVIWLCFFHFSGFLGLIISPAQVHVTSAESLGEESSILSALRFAAARWRSYFWIAVLKLSAELLIPEILFAVLIFGVVLVGLLAGMLNNNSKMGLSTALLTFAIPAIVGFFLFLWLGSCLSLAVPASALERTAGGKALRRSWRLTKGSRLRILVTILMVTVFSWLLMYGLQLICRWIYNYLCRSLGHAFEAESQNFFPWAAYLLYAMPSLLLGSIYPIAFTLFYYDQRIRHEGYDVEKMMESAGMNAAAALPVGGSPITSAPEEEVQA
jgi:hypothetical protein